MGYSGRAGSAGTKRRRSPLNLKSFTHRIPDTPAAARSAPDNISEGFYRFNPPDFANFVRMARGSLGEVRNQLRHAHARKYLNDEEFQELSRLCRRAMGACRGLRLYLLSLPKNFDPRHNKRAHHDASRRPRALQERTPQQQDSQKCEPQDSREPSEREP